MCAGYSEIVRNVFACCAIKTNFLHGFPPFASSKIGHAWNQIKLDGTWYNMDLTWDRGNIVSNRPTHWLLKSDLEFYTDSRPYSLLGTCHSCEESLKEEFLYQYLYGRNIDEKNNTEEPHPNNDTSPNVSSSVGNILGNSDSFINQIIDDVPMSHILRVKKNLESTINRENQKDSEIDL